MADEVTVNCSLSIRKVDADTALTVLVQKSYQGAFRDSMAGAKGPTPGALTVAPRGSGGTQVTFAQLTTPGWCWVEHLGRDDGTVWQAGDWVDIGIYDPATHKFYPLLELRPGMRLPLPLSRNLQEIYLGPGTGTAAGGETARLMCVAYPVAQKVNFEGFEK